MARNSLKNSLGVILRSPRQAGDEESLFFLAFRTREIRRGVYPERRGEERCFASLSMTAKASE